MVALHGHLARGRRRSRLLRDPGPRGLGGLRSRRHLHGPADRVHLLPQAVPRGPPGGGVRGEEGPRPRERPGRPQLPQLRQQGHRSPSPSSSRGLLSTHLGPTQDSRLRRLPAPRDRPGHLHQLRPGADHFAPRSRRSASRQMGKSFRNEITPGNFIFRTREPEQMEMEFFVKPGEDEKWQEYWMEQRWNWYTGLGLREENMRWYEHPAEKLSHYSKRTADIEYRFQLRRQRVGRAGGCRQPHGLRPLLARQGLRPGPLLLRPGGPASAGRRTSSSRRPVSGARCSPSCLDAYIEDEAPNAKGELEKRTVLRLDPRLVAGQGRRAAAVPQPRPARRRRGAGRRRCGRTGTSSSTTPAPSAGGTGVRTRSVRRSA